jgi:hypothetical protein
MPSTRAVYPQVAWCRLASFRVVGSPISAGQLHFWAWFDSRQLHREITGQSHKLWPVSLFHQHLILDNLPAWRSADGGLHNAVIFDGLEAVAKLHIGGYDDAIASISAIVNLKP